VLHDLEAVDQGLPVDVQDLGGARPSAVVLPGTRADALGHSGRGAGRRAVSKPVLIGSPVRTHRTNFWIAATNASP
jgi:hypothetical protein